MPLNFGNPCYQTNNDEHEMAHDQNSVFGFKIAKAISAFTDLPRRVYHYNARRLVYQNNKVKLYHYQAIGNKKYRIPMLVVFATVNRPEILDLFPERSFIGYLLQCGMDVYLLDWGYPDENDKHIGFSHYIHHDLQGCVQFIKESNDISHINLLGICQGALLCLLYTALYQDINKLTLISCPIDFHTKDNMISHIFRRLDVDTLTDTFGTIPGLWLTQFFISLRPFELVGKKYLSFVDHIENQVKTNQFLQVEKWLYDAPDQTARSFYELIHDFYHHNKLVKGKYTLDHVNISLSDIGIPILNIMAEQDEIVPVSASRCLKKWIPSSRYQEAYFPSGHIGIYISDKVGKAMPQQIASWLSSD